MPSPYLALVTMGSAFASSLQADLLKANASSTGGLPLELRPSGLLQSRAYVLWNWIKKKKSCL